jgi:hypothetical protein
MATNFPTSVDNFTNPTANDSLNLPSHSTQHANANDAIEAIEGYLLNGGQGLTLVKKQTIGTAVSSITVTNCFNATYENYKIIVSGGVGSVGSEFYVQLTGITSGYYSQLTYGTFGSNSSPLTVSASNASILNWTGGYSTTSMRLSLEILSPFATTRKTAKGDFMVPISNGNNGESRHWIDSATSSTGFTLTTASGTVTGGTIYVYGYGIGQ